MAESVWANPRLRGRIPELDGLRGLAILLVLVWHYIGASIPVTPGSMEAYAVASLRLTWSGVDLFFVLSGFLIGGILVDARHSGGYFKTFYFRRLHRIFPIYFLWIGLFLAGMYLFRGAGPGFRSMFSGAIPFWSYPLFLQNILMAWRQQFGADWMGITWSLAVEEQFYLLLPLAIRFSAPRTIVKLTAVAALAAPVTRFLLWNSGNDYFGPYTLLPCRFDALGLGVLIAIACRNRNIWNWFASHRRWLIGAFVALGCGMLAFTMWQRYLYVAGLTWIAVFYACLLLLALVNPGRIEGAVLRSRMLTGLGTVAYAVYLLHQGVNGLLHLAVFGHAPAIVDWTSLAVTFGSLAIVLAVAAISWRVLEKPLIRRAHARYQYTERSGKAAAAHASA